MKHWVLVYREILKRHNTEKYIRFVGKREMNKYLSIKHSMVLFTGSENGGGYADVPEEVLKPSFPEQTFTLATWMRHKPIDDGTDKHHKEHIICKADDHSECLKHF